MSPVIRIESFPEENGPQIAGLITQYTGMHAVDELLTKLPVEIEVEGESFEPLKNQLEQLGCNQKVVSLDVLAEELLSPEDQKILALARGKIITRSLQLYWQNFRVFLEFSSILWLPTMVGYSVPYGAQPTYPLVYAVFIGITFALLSQLAYEHLLLASSERLLGREVRFVDTWRRLSVRDFIKFCWTTILVGLIVGVGSMLFLIPGIILAIKLAVSGPVAVIEGKTGPAAIERSFQLTGGHGGTIFGTFIGVGLFIGVANILISFIFVFLGQLWGANQEAVAAYADLVASTVTTPLMAIAITTLYYHVRGLSLKKALREPPERPMESEGDRIHETPGGVEYGSRCPRCNSEYFTSTTGDIYRCDACGARFK